MALSFGGGLGNGSSSLFSTGMTGDSPITAGTPGGNQVLSSMMSAPVVTAAQIITGAVSAYEQYKAGEKAKDIAEKNAALVRAETEEKLRVAEEENRRTEAAARARAAASGLSGASSELYLNALIESGRQDIDWLRKAGAASEDVAISEGEQAFHQARAAMWGSIGSTITSAVSTYSIFR